MKLSDILPIVKVTQKQLAELCRQKAKQKGLPTTGYSQPRISLICRGKVRPKEHEQKVIEEVLDCAGLISWPTKTPRGGSDD